MIELTPRIRLSEKSLEAAMSEWLNLITKVGFSLPSHLHGCNPVD